MEARPAVPLEDVLLMLRGWRDEKRLIQFHISESRAAGFTCFGLGLIEELTAEVLRIDSRNVTVEISLGQRYGCTISLHRADRFEVWDWRNIPAEDASAKELLRESYDMILTAAFGAARCVLQAMNDDWLQK